MKRLAVVALLCSFAVRADELPAWANGTWAAGTWAAGIWGASAAPTTVEVPNVVGQADFATADGLLEADGLDGLEVEECSSAADGEVIRQSPIAGTLVDLGTIITVFTSSGVECVPVLRPRVGLGRGL